MADVDQSVVDEILAKATEDTEEGRLEKLEKEVETLKGSIKRLLLDIRETMNKLENPFVNLQSLAEGNIIPQSAPQIQIVPTNIPLGGEEGEVEEDFQKEVSQEEVGERKEEKKEIEKVEKVKDEAEEKMKTMTTPKPIELKEYGKETNFKSIVDTKRSLDFITFFNLMNWVQNMVSRHSYEAFKLIIEVFEMTGYVNSNTKELILKLADLVKLNGAKEVLIELYKLNKVFNPNDHSLDSDLLALLLDKR